MRFALYTSTLLDAALSAARNIGNTHSSDPLLHPVSRTCGGLR